jgi:TusA-related sulfurtransferase|tara:strand:- start:24757 stop:25023 length:267 start_codon:yes stop_codon:yes gene_type:complete
MKKKFKLSTGKEVELLEMSVDDIDFCNDIPSIMQDKEGNSFVKGMSAARTAWIRKGVKNADDKLIKGLSEDDKNNLALEVRQYQELGE